MAKGVHKHRILRSKIHQAMCLAVECHAPDIQAKLLKALKRLDAKKK